MMGWGYASGYHAMTAAAVVIGVLLIVVTIALGLAPYSGRTGARDLRFEAERILEMRRSVGRPTPMSSPAPGRPQGRGIVYQAVTGSRERADLQDLTHRLTDRAR